MSFSIHLIFHSLLVLITQTAYEHNLYVWMYWEFCTLVELIFSFMMLTKQTVHPNNHATFIYIWLQPWKFVFPLIHIANCMLSIIPSFLGLGAECPFQELVLSPFHQFVLHFHTVLACNTSVCSSFSLQVFINLSRVTLSLHMHTVGNGRQKSKYH